MSYNFYKILHLISLFTLFLSYGIIISHTHHFRKWASSLHGLSCLFLFISGFGLIAKAQIPLGLAESIFIPILYSLFWLIPLIICFFLKNIRFSVHSYYEAFQPFLILIFFYMSIFELSKIISPEWIGAKLTSWIILAFGVPILASKKKKRVHPIALAFTSCLLIFIGYLTVHFAIYKN